MALRHSVGELASTLLSIMRTRLELFSLEAAEQKSRLLQLIAMMFGALVFLILAVLVFSILVALYFWPTDHRYTALLVLGLIYTALGVGLLLCVRSHLFSGPPPFAATLDELQRDMRLAGRLSGSDRDSSATNSDKDSP